KERPERKATLDANHDSTAPKDPSGLSYLPHGHPIQSPKVEENRKPESRMMRKYPGPVWRGAGGKGAYATSPAAYPTIGRVSSCWLAMWNCSRMARRKCIPRAMGPHSTSS